ncbi:division/cell wall cluster transcriptional repressor MraZ [Gordonia jinhuaensis]|uniref:division/cell wall cluster transcriptional repressor MraZ n=1 Tax=Gordonia jinhuaensis TaxID=1517702 RepID=UPI001669F5A8|nr:division/cell wall cluster transcriptional repressor MraZ [Gordonia jinhuaensis]
MFLGTYTPKLDDKGRLTLPARFRDALAGGVMITKNQHHSLAVYTRERFEELAMRALDASRNNPTARDFQRQLAAGTDEQRPDSQGRITLSAEHRRYASLSKDCVVIGNMQNLEIWDSATWADYQAAQEEDYSEKGFTALDSID